MQNNIAFVTLIPNATHVLQPLDVVVFRSVKIKWCGILDGWRKESKYCGVLSNHFPGLLWKLHNIVKVDNTGRFQSYWPLSTKPRLSTKAFARCQLRWCNWCPAYNWCQCLLQRQYYEVTWKALCSRQITVSLHSLRVSSLAAERNGYSIAESGELD